MLEDIDRPIVFKAPFRNGTLRAAWPVWDSEPPPIEEWNGCTPDRFIFYVFVEEPQMKKRGLYFESCENWPDPSKTRAAVREILVS